MTTRFADLTAATMAKLGLGPAAAPKPEAKPMPADKEDEGDGGKDEGEENPDGTPKKNKKKGEADGAAEAEANAAADAAVVAAVTQSATAATAAANARWADVLGSDEANGRTAQAIVMLGSTALDATAVKAALAKFPKEATGGLSERMKAEVPNPGVTAGGGGEAEPKIADTVKDAFAASRARLFPKSA